MMKVGANLTRDEQDAVDVLNETSLDLVTRMLKRDAPYGGETHFTSKLRNVLGELEFVELAALASSYGITPSDGAVRAMRDKLASVMGGSFDQWGDGTPVDEMYGDEG